MNTRDRVAVCSRSFSQDPRLRKELLARYSNVTFNETGRTLKGDELAEFLSGHQKAIIGLEVVDRQLVAKLPMLQVIGKYGVGMDKVDFACLQAAGIRFGWTPGVNRRAVAELTIGFALSLLRGVAASGLGVRMGRWEVFKGRELGSATLGLVGCGHVGKEVAKLARAFGAKVLAYDIVPNEEFYSANGVLAAPDLASLLGVCDIVSLHVPLNASTQGLFSSAVLAQMRDGAYLINTARGGIVDEIALREGLRTGRIAGAAFDVFAEEPPTDRELLTLANFLATPHIGGSSSEAILAMGRAAIAGLDDFREARTFVDELTL